MRYGLDNLAPSDSEPVRNSTVCGTDARGADSQAGLTVIAQTLRVIVCARQVGCYLCSRISWKSGLSRGANQVFSHDSNRRGGDKSGAVCPLWKGLSEKGADSLSLRWQDVVKKTFEVREEHLLRERGAIPLR